MNNEQQFTPLAHTVQDSARLTQLSERTIRRAIKSGRLRAVRVGRAVRISHDSLLQFLNGIAPRQAAVERGHERPCPTNKETGEDR